MTSYPEIGGLLTFGIPGVQAGKAGDDASPGSVRGHGY